MEITKVKVIKQEQEGTRLKGYGEIVFDNCFIIHDLRIIEGKDRLFVAMPNKRVNNDHIDLVHPLNSKCRKMIEEAILKEYRK